MNTSRKARRKLAALVRRKDSAKQLVNHLLHKIDDVEYLALLEDENVKLNRKNSELENVVAPRLAALPELHKERERASAAMRKYQALQATGRLDIERLPETLPDVLDLFERLYGDLVIFTAEARRSAAAATMNEVPGGMGIVWMMLRGVALELLPLYVHHLSDIPRRFQDATGFELALGESALTKSSKRMMAEREIEHEHGRLDGSPHIKYGVRPPRLLRIHYGFCPVCPAIVIGHCGDHLQTAGALRRKA